MYILVKYLIIISWETYSITSVNLLKTFICFQFKWSQLVLNYRIQCSNFRVVTFMINRDRDAQVPYLQSLGTRYHHPGTYPVKDKANKQKFTQEFVVPSTFDNSQLALLTNRTYFCRIFSQVWAAYPNPSLWRSSTVSSTGLRLVCSSSSFLNT